MGAVKYACITVNLVLDEDCDMSEVIDWLVRDAKRFVAGRKSRSDRWGEPARLVFDVRSVSGQVEVWDEGDPWPT